MKKTTITLAVALLAFGATTAFSQANLNLRVDVPFAFSVEGRHYAAGPYEVRGINTSTARLLNFDTGDAGLIKLINSEAVRGRNIAAPVLRFVVNGEHGYLISLTDGDGNGWNVPVASKDLEALREPPSKSVVVAVK